MKRLKQLSKKELADAPFLIKFVAEKGDKYPNITKECSIKYPQYYEI